VEIVGTQPISLETAIELAYRNSEELRIAQLQLERSYEGLRAERALLLPTADLNATLEVTDQTNFGFGLGNTATRLNSGIRTDYDLGVSGERAARIRAAEDQVRLATLQVERTQVELRLNTITDYYAVQEASEQIRINQAFLQEAEENLRITRLREEVGVGTRFDVLRAEVQVANARQNITQARSQRDIAQRQLARRLNVPPSINLTTLGVEIQGTWPLGLEESIVLAYQNRAELEQFLVEREFNEAQRQATLARTRPNVGLFAQYNFQALLITPEGVPTGTNDGFSLGAQLAWRLYDGGGTQARAAQNELDIRIDEFEFENIRNTIRVQVEEAYYTLQANQANINTATIAVNQAQQAQRLANLRFEAGVGTQTDVLSATSELTQAEGNLVRAKLDYNRALARMERAVSNLGPLTR
jgi:outer membrane protein TolC